MVMLQSLNKLLGTPLLSKIGSLTKLSVLLLESLVESWQFYLCIVLDVSLLIFDNLVDFVFELRFTLHL